MTTVKNHPLESVFGMSSGTMNFSLDAENEMIEVPPEVTQVAQEDDDEDREIKEQIAFIYDKAMEAYDLQTELTEVCEPRYAARLAEVSNQTLNTALNAVALRSKNKNEKRKNSTFIPYGNNISNSQIVMADRNSLLEMFAERKKLSSDS